MSSEANWLCQNNLHLNTINNENPMAHHHHHHNFINSSNNSNMNGLLTNVNNPSNMVNGSDVNSASFSNMNAAASSSSSGGNYFILRNNHLPTELISNIQSQSSNLGPGNSTFTELQPAAFTQLPSIDTLSSGTKRK